MLKNKLFLILFIFFSTFSFLIIGIADAHAGSIEISQDEIWTENKTIEGVVNINPGATLTISKGASIIFKGANSGISVDGRLVVRGTVTKPVRFDLDGDIPENNFYGITVRDGGEASISNAEIKNGGYYYVPTQAFLKRIKEFFFKTALAVYNTGAVGVEEGGKLKIEHCYFHNNRIGVAVYWGKNFNESDVRVNRSKFENNYPFDVVNSANIIANFQYNWWGRAYGPDADKIYGNLNTENYISKENFHDPVVIVPGILGSWKITENGEWKIDPITRTFDNLMASFKANGYEEGVDLFIFPYQWRDSNINNAEILKEKIQEIKQVANWPKVDVVAHSMGGLLTRYYVESDEYQDDIDQLIMLGTPQWGSPKDYLIWEGGEGFYGVGGFLFEHLVFTQEAHESGFENIVDYLHNMPIESVRELLPIYNYLEESNSGELRIYPNNYPQNNFLESLNSADNLAKLNNIEWEIITGNLENSASTISKIKVKESGTDGLWENGEADELVYGEGDGTVPKYLEDFDIITNLADESIEINSAHSDLPTKAQCYVIKNLTGQNDCEYVSTFDRIKSILTFVVFSPVDIQVISPSGKKVGKNFETGEILNEIDGAYYTGYNTENEFLTIPYPENGEYKILTQGTGSGEYKIEIAKISENEDGKTEEISGEIEGMAVVGSQEEKIAQLTSEEIITEKPDTVPPIIEISSPKNKIYRSDEIIPITFTISDEDSEVAEEKTKIFLDNENFSENSFDAAYFTPGGHSLKISAEDKAGNQNERVIEFSIYPTTYSIISNVEHYYTDNFITRKSTKNYLEAKLKVIKMHQMFYNSLKLCYWPIKHKDKLLDNLSKNINREIDRLIDDIQKQKSISRTILESAKSILVANLEELKM